MCNNCYHSIGRNKKAWKCSHTTKSHYALGVCQNCYQSRYVIKTKKTEDENVLITESELQKSDIENINEEKN